MANTSARGLRKLSQLRFFAAATHAILFVAAWGSYFVSGQPMMNGWSATPFTILMLADTPISWVAFGALWGGTSVFAVTMLWGLFGTLWWYLLGRSAEALYHRIRKSAPSREPGIWGAWVIGIACLVALVLIGFLGAENRVEQREYGGEIRDITFSPDKQTILLTRTEGDSAFLYKVDLKTGIATRLTQNAAGKEGSAAYSPDGSTVVFTFTQSDERFPHLYVVQADGNHLHPLFYDQKDTSDFFPLFGSNGKIMFARQSTESVRSPWNAYSVSVDGSGLKQLTNPPGFTDVFLASVSSDEKRLLLHGSLENERFVIYSLETDSIIATLKPQVPDASSSAIYVRPKFTPDGKSIIFMAASQGMKGFDYDIYRLDLKSNAIERLTRGNGYATELNISADGKEALFLKWTSKLGSLPVNSRLYILDLENLQVTETPITGRTNN